jgi:hypothetical protein
MPHARSAHQPRNASKMQNKPAKKRTIAIPRLCRAKNARMSSKPLSPRTARPKIVDISAHKQREVSGSEEGFTEAARQHP